MENSSTDSTTSVSSATEGNSPSSLSPESGSAKEGQPNSGKELTTEELVEIKLGQRQMKLSKADAENVKGFEKAAREAMRKSAATEKQFASFMEQVKTNPREFLKHVGIDPYEFSEMTLAEKLAELQKTPEQREIDELRKKTSKYEENEKRQKELSERAEQERIERNYQQKLEKELLDGFKASGLPNKPSYFKMVVSELRAAALRGEDLTAEEACRKIKSDIQDDYRASLKDLPAEAILKEYLGEDLFKKVREYDLSRITGSTAPTANSGEQKRTPPQTGAHPSEGRNSKKYVNEREYRAYMESLKSR